ncbi:hypothetical protein FHS43_001454 [Streptosporangium becharense]|uniref:Uncharacterized protein n=1 Tax=Streptosporangium becharense TaxID=1816182 RepID=A0A7W9ILG6_9ACTN|nr:hypothetical protein [Streptosporangium becharense]MBB2910191.1 hypothetical protein [Streptosporangium becharense]MBB5822934.1 hypothetical protein [Streptosporangium becharense]
MTVTRFQDLPLADADRTWDSGEADKRVRSWAGAEEEPNARYREAHVWYDGDAPGDFGSYKLPIADVIGGELKVVPHAVRAAGGVMQGARGGVDVPAEEVARIKSHLAKYYAKMGETAPWDR